MKYRTLGRTGLSVSEIGMGCEGMMEKPFETVLAYVDEMGKLGVNIIDLLNAEISPAGAALSHHQCIHYALSRPVWPACFAARVKPAAPLR